MKRFITSLALLSATAALVSACGAPSAAGAGETPLVPTLTPTATPIVSHGSRVTDLASLRAALQRVGATVQDEGALEQPFFSVKGLSWLVDGQGVQVFEYATATEAETEAAQVAQDGRTIGTSLPSWLGTPNFFKAGQLIVLYVGEDALVLDHLSQVLGLPFAGGPFFGQDSTSVDGITPGGSALLPAANAARQALAAARDLLVEQITVISAEPVEWPNACLGVERPEETCAAVVTPGYRVTLQVGAEQVIYHTDELGTVVKLVPAGSAALAGSVWADRCVLLGGEGQATTPSGGCVADGAGGYRADGVWGEGEKRLVGVLVTLTPGGCPGDVARARSVTTDANGAYQFEALSAGAYCVAVDPLHPQNAPLLIPGGWTFPAAEVGFVSVELAAGEQRAEVNFGWDAQFDAP